MFTLPSALRTVPVRYDVAVVFVVVIGLVLTVCACGVLVAHRGMRRVDQTYASVMYVPSASLSHTSVVRTEPRTVCPDTPQTAVTRSPLRSDPTTSESSDGADRTFSVVRTATVADTPAASAAPGAKPRPAPTASTSSGPASNRREYCPMKTSPSHPSASVRRSRRGVAGQERMRVQLRCGDRPVGRPCRAE